MPVCSEKYRKFWTHVHIEPQEEPPDPDGGNEAEDDNCEEIAA